MKLNAKKFGKIFAKLSQTKMAKTTQTEWQTKISVTS